MQKKLEYIDALRGIAVLGVLAVHIGAQTLNGNMRTVASLGAKGVQLFYFISAFTLFLSFHTKAGIAKNKSRDFFIRRLFRIMPMYYLGILYYSVIIPGYENSAIDIKGVLLNLFLVHGFSPKYINSIVPGGWSIATEVLFYTLVPILVLKINSLNKAIATLIFSLIVKIAFYLILKNNPFHVNNGLWIDYLYWYLPNQIPSFLFGIIFYFVTKLENFKQTVAYNVKFFVGTCVTLLILFTIDKSVIRANLFNFDFWAGIFFLATAIIIRRFPLKTLVNRFTILTGKLSYSIYLTHFAVIYWLIKIGLKTNVPSGNLAGFFFSYITVLGLTLIISYFSYQYLEIKFQDIGKKIISKSESRNV